MLDARVELRRTGFGLDVALAVGPGERFALWGPSGSGKTTVLEVIAGLQPLDGGWVRLDGQELSRVEGGRRLEVPAWRRGVVLLRQAPSLFPHLDVRSNLTYAGAVEPARLDRMVDTLEIGDLLSRSPGRLSGGQAQRVALGRALLSPHRALLLDEPYSGLDARLRATLGALVRDELRRSGVPGVLVAHELADAQAFADRLGVLDAGHLLQVGSPAEVVRRPADRRVAELVGYEGFVPHEGRVVAVHPERVRTGARPDEGVILDAVVRASRPAGARYRVELVVEGETLVCLLDEPPPPAGSRLVLTAVDPPLLAPARSGPAPNARVEGAVGSGPSGREAGARRRPHRRGGVPADGARTPSSPAPSSAAVSGIGHTARR